MDAPCCRTSVFRRWWTPPAALATGCLLTQYASSRCPSYADSLRPKYELSSKPLLPQACHWITSTPTSIFISTPLCSKCCCELAAISDWVAKCARADPAYGYPPSPCGQRDTTWPHESGQSC